MVDTLGRIIAVVVTVAHIDAREGLVALLHSYFADGVTRLRKLWVDGGLYRSTVFWTPSGLKLCGISQGTSLLLSHLGRGFVSVPPNQPRLIVLTLKLVQR